MSNNRQQYRYPRADSPPLIGRIPTPPHYTGVQTSWQRPSSPPLIGRIPTPPHTAHSLTPARRSEVRGRGRQPAPSVGSRLYNLFHPRSRRVEIVETPVRRSHTVRVQRAPTPPPALRRTRTSRRRAQPTTPAAQTVVPPSPPRRNVNHGMSPVFPEDYVPMPQPQPQPHPPAQQGNPTTPRPTERRPGSSPRGPEEHFADHYETREVIGDDEPRVVTEQRPVHARPGSREAVLFEQNKAYRDKNKRLSRELEKRESDIANLKASESELRQQLNEAREQARRAQRGSDAQMDDLRDQLARCKLDREDKQQQLDQERLAAEYRERELDHLRRQDQVRRQDQDRRQPTRPTVIHQDDEERVPRPRPGRQNTESRGIAAIREAQANANRGRGRGYGG